MWVEEEYSCAMVGKEHRTVSRGEEEVKQQSFLNFQKHLDVFAAEVVDGYYQTTLLEQVEVHVSS